MQNLTHRNDKIRATTRPYTYKVPLNVEKKGEIFGNTTEGNNFLSDWQKVDFALNLKFIASDIGNIMITLAVQRKNVH